MILWRLMTGSLLAVLILTLLSVPGPVLCNDRDERVSSEEKIKAAYLFNFLKFADWDASLDDSQLPGDVFRLSVIGESSMNQVLLQLAGRKVRGRTLEVLLVESAADIPPSHLVYTPELDAEKLSLILPQISHMGVLTVGEGELFIHAGGVIGFFSDEGVVRFLVSRKAASVAGIHLHTQLLQIAKLLEDD